MEGEGEQQESRTRRAINKIKIKPKAGAKLMVVMNFFLGLCFLGVGAYYFYTRNSSFIPVTVFGCLLVLNAKILLLGIIKQSPTLILVYIGTGVLTWISIAIFGYLQGIPIEFITIILAKMASYKITFRYYQQLTRENNRPENLVEDDTVSIFDETAENIITSVQNVTKSPKSEEEKNDENGTKEDNKNVEENKEEDKKETSIEEDSLQGNGKNGIHKSSIKIDIS